MTFFSSRHPKFRSPTGPVPSGSSIHFRVTLPRNLGCSAARLIVEQEGLAAQLRDMFWGGMNGDDKEWWECDFTPPSPGLYF